MSNLFSISTKISLLLVSTFVSMTNAVAGTKDGGGGGFDQYLQFAKEHLSEVRQQPKGYNKNVALVCKEFITKGEDGLFLIEMLLRSGKYQDLFPGAKKWSAAEAMGYANLVSDIRNQAYQEICFQKDMFFINQGIVDSFGMPLAARNTHAGAIEINPDLFKLSVMADKCETSFPDLNPNVCVYFLPRMIAAHELLSQYVVQPLERDRKYTFSQSIMKVASVPTPNDGIHKDVQNGIVSVLNDGQLWSCSLAKNLSKSVSNHFIQRRLLRVGKAQYFMNKFEGMLKIAYDTPDMRSSSISSEIDKEIQACNDLK